MSAVTQVVKSVGPKLVPFFKTVAIYFVAFPPYEVPSLLTAVLKCLPILSLMLFVVLHGMSLGDEHRYARKILTGLIFSCVGDAFLVWPNCFVYGMLAFAIGHIHYIQAFGFEPLKLKLGALIFSLNALGLVYILPGLSGILLPGVIIYSAVLTTMLWRATARVQLFDDLWTWSKLCACAGAMLFVFSDFLLSVNVFVAPPFEYSPVLVMSTYYAAQLGIALSVVDSKINRSQQLRPAE